MYFKMIAHAKNLCNAGNASAIMSAEFSTGYRDSRRRHFLMRLHDFGRLSANGTPTLLPSPDRDAEEFHA